MKRVILNADDYGLCPEVTCGILRAAEAGAITSTSVLANLCPREDLGRLRESGLASGLHVNLVEGRPLTGPAGLEPVLDHNGRFVGIARLARAMLCNGVTVGRLREELEAQARVLLDANLRIDHLDGHQHAHLLPRVTEAAAQVALAVGAAGVRMTNEPFSFKPGDLRATAKKLMILPFTKVAARCILEHGLRKPDAFFGVALVTSRDPEAIRDVLARLPEGVTEIALHLATGNNPLFYGGLLNRWHHMLAALCGMDIGREVARQGGCLVTFATAWPDRTTETAGVLQRQIARTSRKGSHPWERHIG